MRLLIVISIICLSCQRNKTRNCEASNVTLTIINKQIRFAHIDSINFRKRKLLNYDEKERLVAKNLIDYKLTNYSNKKLFFVVDESAMGYNELNFLAEINQYKNTRDYNLGIFYNITSKSNKQPGYISFYSMNQDLLHDKDEADRFQRDKIFHDLEELNTPNLNKTADFNDLVLKYGFILSPGQSRYFRKVIYLPIENEANEYNNRLSYFLFNSSTEYYFNLFYICDSLSVKSVLPDYKLKELRENHVSIYDGVLLSEKTPLN